MIDFNQKMKLLIEEKSSSTGVTIRNGDIPGVAEITAAADGPRLLLISGIHGNELAGVEAVISLLRQFCDGTLALKKGTLKMVIANEEAIKLNKRYVNENLNRLFLDDAPEPKDPSYEWKRAQELKPLLREADYFLDLHSTSGPSEAYIFCEEPQIAKCKALGLKNIVVGWGSLGCSSIAGDTENYGLKHSSIGFTVECGRHADEITYKNALQISLNFLGAHDLIDHQIEPVNHQLYYLQSVYEKQDESFIYRKPLSNLESLAKGEIIGFSNGEEVKAPYDCAIVLPTDPAIVKIGEGLFLFAKKEVASPGSG